MFYKNKKGVTLIELVCVVAIIAIIGAIAGIGIARAVASSKEKAYKAELENYFAIASTYISAVNNGKSKSKLSDYVEWIKKNDNERVFANTKLESEIKSKVSPDDYSVVKSFFAHGNRIPKLSSAEGIYLDLALINDKYVKLSACYMIQAGNMFSMVKDSDGFWSATKIS